MSKARVSPRFLGYELSYVFYCQVFGYQAPDIYEVKVALIANLVYIYSTRGLCKWLEIEGLYGAILLAYLLLHHTGQLRREW